MNFNNKLNKFNDNYETIKKNIRKAIKNNLIKIGDGGSSNIIVINDDNILKIIPTFKRPLLKIELNNDDFEYIFYKKFTDEFITTNITPHIVGFYKKYLLDNINILLPPKCYTLDEKLLSYDKKDNITEKLCYIKKGVEKRMVNIKASIFVLEKCTTTISDEIDKILKTKIPINNKKYLFTQILRRILFQFIFTMAIIQDKYPNFIHNDMFLRNILAVKEYDYEYTDYVEYNYKSKKYYLPANGIYIKINDFGFSLNITKQNSSIEKEIKSHITDNFELVNNKRDIYTFLFDLYDGPNLGSQSVKTIINNNLSKKINKLFLEILKKEIGNLLNYKIIDKINSINLGILDWQWNISESKLLMNSIKKPTDYFDQNNFKYFTYLPTNGRVVEIFNK
jgi:hypothetical protein